MSEELLKQLKVAKAALDDYNKLFALQRSRMHKAVDRWRMATNEHNTSPDLGDLLDWLLAEIDRLEKERDDYWAEVQYLRPILDKVEGGKPPEGEINRNLRRELDETQKALSTLSESLWELETPMKKVLHIIDSGFLDGKDENTPAKNANPLLDMCPYDHGTLELSTRSRTCLHHEGIDTVRQLVSMTRSELLRCRNLGRGCLKEIKHNLAEHGLNLSTPRKKWR